MAFNPLGLAALVVSAIRSAVTDPELVAKVEANRAAFDSLTGQLATVQETLTANDALDTAQQETLSGIVTELQALADALTGPAASEEDLGLAGEVETTDEGEASPTVDLIAEEGE